jgi:predicted esterase
LKLGVAAIIAFSGILIDPDVAIANPKTKLLMLHGESDQVCPLELMQNSISRIREKNLLVSLYIDSGVGHCISGNIMRNALEFLQTID